MHPVQTACDETHAAQFSRWGLGRRSIPAERVASRSSSLRFGRNTLGIPPSRALSAGPSPRETHMIASACTPRRHENAVPWTVPVSARRPSMQSDAQAREPRPGELGRPLVGTARRRRAAGKDPELADGSPLGRDPGVQRHPDGCVVRAFRCASRSGAGPHRETGQRSAFPCGRHDLDGWGPAGLHFHSN